MDSLPQRLSVRFPEATTEQIDRAIRGSYEGFDNSTLRDYIPVLVERAARAALAARTRRSPGKPQAPSADNAPGLGSP